VFKKRGGRKLVVTPDDAEWAPRPRVDNAMVKALARAFRWRKILDGACDTGGFGAGEGCRAVLREPSSAADAVAPEIVDVILDGRQSAELQLDDLLEGFPLDWTAQRSDFI
jgi:hypothetical protein